MAIVAICGAGDNIVTTSFLYGGTYNAFKVFFANLGSALDVLLRPRVAAWRSRGTYTVEFRFVEGDNPDDFVSYIDERTKGICKHLHNLFWERFLTTLRRRRRRVHWKSPVQLSRPPQICRPCAFQQDV